MTKIIKKVQLESEQKNTTQTSAYKGTQSTPFSQSEFEQLLQEETWPGGYVEGMGYVVPAAGASGDTNYWETFHEWCSKFQDFTARLGSSLNSLFHDSAYAQAVSQYHSGAGGTITLDVGALGLNHIKLNMLSPEFTDTDTNKKARSINLLSPSIIPSLISNSSSKATTISTMLALGKITFLHEGGNQYSIKDDDYDFNMEYKWSSLYRDVATIIGHITSEELSTIYDYILLGPLGVALGLVQRYGFGTTKFVIHFTGTLTIK